MRKRSSSEQETGRDGSFPPPKPAWSATVTVADVPDTGRHVDLVADAMARETIARMAGLAALPRLEASFDLTRQGTDGLHAVGSVTAQVVQTCVVTLDPIESEIEETIDLVFTPQAAARPAAAAKPLQSIDADDPPEALHDGVVDLGAVATEFLLLGMDPYPRKPGVVFDPPSAGDTGNRPFAALAALKKPTGRKDG